MRTWCGSDADPRERRWKIILGWIRCVVRPWFWPAWRRIWVMNTRNSEGHPI